MLTSLGGKLKSCFGEEHSDLDMLEWSQLSQCNSSLAGSWLGPYTLLPYTRASVYFLKFNKDLHSLLRSSCLWPGETRLAVSKILLNSHSVLSFSSSKDLTWDRIASFVSEDTPTI